MHAYFFILQSAIFTDIILIEIKNCVLKLLRTSYINQIKTSIKTNYYANKTSN